MNFEEMKAVLESAAKEAGISQYEIYCARSESISAEALEDKISAFASGMGSGICFRCLWNQKLGYASSELFTEEALRELPQKALENAKVINSDEEGMIFAGSPAYATVPKAEFQMPTAGEIRQKALELQRKVYAQSKKVGEGTQSGAIYEISETYLCNSHGLKLSNRAGMGVLYSEAIVRKGKNAESGFACAEMQNEADCENLASLAVKRGLERLGAVTVPSGKYPILMDGRAVREFLAAYASAFSARNAQKGLSRLAGKEETAVAADCITVLDDPMEEGYPLQASFDGEGVATAKHTVIEKGILKTLLYDLSTAQKAGVASTGNGQKSGYASPVSIRPYRFSIQAGTTSEKEMLSGIKDGILVTGCKGFHAGANAVTGDFSMESYGFRIREGKIAEAVHSFTISGNFFELLLNARKVGDKIKWGMPSGFTAFGSPDILFAPLSVAGD